MSEAEARIRAKAERLLRGLFPDARIVHEFVVGGVRLDLAAITSDRLILAEIKSELDSLARLERQVVGGRRVGGPLLVCFAPKWRDGVRRARAAGNLWGAEWLEETEDGFAGLVPARIADRFDRWSSRALLSLLLKPEILELTRPFGGRGRNTVAELRNMAHEHLTGRQIRLATMAALRARRFGWVCDPPIEKAQP